VNTAAKSLGAARKEFARGLARALAGAILFSFPLLMTMEMWWLGFYLDRLRLLIMLLVTLALLVPLSYLVGFERTGTFAEDVKDALVAFGVGAIASTIMLLVFGVIGAGMPATEIVGNIAVQTVPASIGAIVARGQMSGEQGGAQEKLEEAGYPAQLFIMLAGAVFLAFNVAPTEEMILIAFKMTPLHGIALVLLSILALHAFIFALDFRGGEELPKDIGLFGAIFRHSIAGYGIALLVSAYVLWTFGRLDGASAGQMAMMIAVLGFPSALGAAAARLVI
jgi:putative integral membrane protein (TIGR02587 family)